MKYLNNFGLLLIYGLLVHTCITAITFIVNPSTHVINTVASYDWIIMGLTTGISTIRLQLPTSVALNSTNSTGVLLLNGTVYGGNFTTSGTAITITLLPSDQTNTTLTFKTTFIKNPSYNSKSGLGQNIQVTQGNVTITNSIQYSSGPISGCSLSFSGFAEQAVSTAFLDFQTTNPISANRVIFRIDYGINLGTYTFTTSKIVDNRNITCAFLQSNGTYSSEVIATFQLNNPTFYCNFNNLNLTANHTVKLRLTNVKNPPYKNNYLLQPFNIQTYQSSSIAYDISQNCNLTDVALFPYQSKYTQNTININNPYSNPTILTIQTISTPFRINDTILIEHNGLSFTQASTSINFTRPNSQTLYFTVQSRTDTQVVTQYISNSNIIPVQQNNYIQITLSNFVMKGPPSASPVNITFRFLRNSGVVSLEFLNIFATLAAVPATFISNDLTISTLDNSVGTRTTYIFNISISHSLSNSAFILLNLPLELDITQFSSNSNCTFLAPLNTVVQVVCSIFDSINKVIIVNVNSTSGINLSQMLTITINDIINPVNPQRTYIFGANTYYQQGDLSSQVQLGAGITPYTYIFRTMNISTSNRLYTVNQNPAILTIIYIPGVNIPSNILLVFNFTTNITSLNYLNVSVNNASFVYSMSSNGQIINLTVSHAITAGSNVVINFQFRAPTSVDYYPAVTAQAVSITGIVYQRMQNYLAISVSYPASQIFSLTPTSLVTRTTTNYTLNFYTNVYHPPLFYLIITFPRQMTINLTNIRCFAPCNSIKDITVPGSTQTVLLNITAFSTSNIYNIIITNITNPRKIGTSSFFNLATWTKETNGNMILNGSTAVTINYPNIANAILDLTKSYYRMNIQPVNIIINSLANSLLDGDFIRVRFDYRTYNLASTGSPGVLCANDYTCVHEVNQSTSFTSVISVLPKTAVTRSLPIKFAIQGLNSSSNIFIPQQFQIILQTYSSDGAQMDEGTFNYNLSCRSPSALINKNCRTCNESTQMCLTCYPGLYLYNGTCVNDCTSSSTYRAFANSTICVPCQNNCSTCISQTQCLSCVPPAGSLIFYLFENSTCKSQCDGVDGYYSSFSTTADQWLCLRCWSLTCVTCINGNSNGCIDCGRTFLQDGRCIDSCDLSTNFVSTSGECLPCNQKCNGCTGRQNTQCIVCRPGYYNVSGACVSSCPQGKVGLSNNTCGCQGLCRTCSQFSTRCQTCLHIDHLLYNYQCRTDCPGTAYRDGSKCIDCKLGCFKCTKTSCLECLAGYNIYENQCYSQCNSISARFSAVNGSCIECPVGCDLCDAQLRCSVCLDNYTLVNNTICQKTCQIQKNCQIPNPVPDKILPIPGVITAAVWLAIVIVLKIFFIQKIYMPYTYIFIGCIVELVQTLIIIIKMNESINKLIIKMSSRLLQTVSSTDEGPQLYQYAIVGILASVIAFNYLSNFAYLFLFCKYLRKYIPDRQIDKISNYLVLILGTLTNYRFSLLAYSKLFPKPSITVQNQSKLTPIHYMCIASLITSFLPLTGAGILIYNQYPLTDLFMLGVDLLIIIIFSIVFTIWMIAVDKPSDYFQSTKKYTKQQINNTIEALNQKQNLNESKNKLGHNMSNVQNSIIHVEDVNDQMYVKQHNFEQNIKHKQFKSDNQNQPLPKIPIRTSQINISTNKINNTKANNIEVISQSSKDQQIDGRKLDQNIGDKKTKRNKTNVTQVQKNKKQDNKIVNQHQNQQYQRGIKPRNKQLPKNFSKQKKKGPTASKNKNEGLQIKMNNMNNSKNIQNNQSQEIQQSMQIQNISMDKARSDIIKGQKRLMKPQTQRSSGILPITMKKNQSIGMFDSEKASSQIDQIDFESLIQTKMIDKTKDKHKTIPVSKSHQNQPEQISPSWFNQQNQRYDFQESSDI